MDAVSYNIRQALPIAYYEQLKDTLFGYKEVSPRDYFDHLDDHWCKMDTKTTKSMKNLVVNLGTSWIMSQSSPSGWMTSKAS